MAGLTEYIDSDPTTLSQGQKQKLAIASVLALEPEALIWTSSVKLGPQERWRGICDTPRAEQERNDDNSHRA